MLSTSWPNTPRGTVLLAAFTLCTALPVSSVAAAEVQKGELVSAEKATQSEGSSLAWYDLKLLDVEGRAFDDTENFYDRLPARAKGEVRDAVWSLSQDSAGMYARFVTDATTISARWTLRKNRLAMSHMAATGVSGLDLYVKVDGTWRWVGVGRPEKLPTNQSTLLPTVPQETREFLLYLPLYNGVSDVQLGIPAGAKLWQAAPAEAKPIVFYGTSITQGGCASRPGMVHTSILGRNLDHPVVNLGFSGNGRMELEVGKYIAEIDAAAYVIDCLPNINAAEVAERTEPLVRQLRKAHPQTPIVLVEDRTYSNSFLVQERQERNDTSRAALRAAYERLQKAGVKNLYYLEGETLLGADGDDTVDSSHPTDLGFYRQAQAFQPLLEKVLKDHR